MLRVCEQGADGDLICSLIWYCWSATVSGEFIIYSKKILGIVEFVPKLSCAATNTGGASLWPPMANENPHCMNSKMVSGVFVNKHVHSTSMSPV